MITAPTQHLPQWPWVSSQKRARQSPDALRIPQQPPLSFDYPQQIDQTSSGSESARRTDKVPLGQAEEWQTQFFKTKMCPYHLEGRCINGTVCRFAHCPNEMRPLPDLQRTKLCDSFVRKQVCRDLACPFAHDPSELRTSSGSFYKVTLCNFYKKGRCWNGPHCRFAHGSGELQAPVLCSPRNSPGQKVLARTDSAPLRSSCADRALRESRSLVDDCPSDSSPNQSLTSAILAVLSTPMDDSSEARQLAAQFLRRLDGKDVAPWQPKSELLFDDREDWALSECSPLSTLTCLPRNESPLGNWDGFARDEDALGATTASSEAQTPRGNLDGSLDAALLSRSPKALRKLLRGLIPDARRQYTPSLLGAMEHTPLPLSEPARRDVMSLRFGKIGS